MHRVLMIILIALLPVFSYASSNTLISLTTKSTDKSDILTFGLLSAVAVEPVTFTTSPTKIVIDLDSTNTELPRKNPISGGNVSSVIIIHTVDRFRIVINLINPATYKITTENNNLYVTIDTITRPDIKMESVNSDEELINQAKTIIGHGAQIKDALEPLNLLLMMAPGQYTQEANELIALVYEKMGEIEKAKGEYKAYLAIYPNSPKFKQIREHLIALEIADPDVTTNISTKRKPREGSDQMFNTSISEYYYLSSTSGSLFDLNVDQSSLITNIRTSGMYRQDQYVTRLVFRESSLSNLISTGQDKNVLSIGYISLEDTFIGYEIKLGRQNPTMGELGRYDGASAWYNLTPSTKIKASTGIPYTGSTPTNRTFYGVGAEMLISDEWSSNFYYNYQIADNLPERSAFGAEARYYKNGWSLFTALEYDSIYDAINSVVIQGSISLDPYNVYFLADKRKSPVLFADRALMLGINTPDHRPFSSIADITHYGYTTDQIYSFVNTSTAYASSFMIGVGKQLTSQWQISTDLQVSNVSSSTDTIFVPSIDEPVSILSQPATGNMFSLSVRLYGTDILSKDDLVTVILNSTQDDTTSSETLMLFDSKIIADYRLDTLLMLSSHNQIYSSSDTVTASLHVNYKISNRSAIEAQLSVSQTTLHDSLQGTNTNTYNQSVFIGWRMDF